MEDLAVFIALNHSGSFRMYFVKFKKKCYLPAKGRSVWWKTVTSAAFSRPRSQFFTIWTSQPANNIYILLLLIESKIHILSPSRNILCLYSIGMVKGDFRILVGLIRITFSPKADSFKEALLTTSILTARYSLESMRQVRRNRHFKK